MCHENGKTLCWQNFATLTRKRNINFFDADFPENHPETAGRLRRHTRNRAEWQSGRAQEHAPFGQSGSVHNDGQMSRTRENLWTRPRCMMRAKEAEEGVEGDG